MQTERIGTWFCLYSSLIYYVQIFFRCSFFSFYSSHFPSSKRRTEVQLFPHLILHVAAFVAVVVTVVAFPIAAFVVANVFIVGVVFVLVVAVVPVVVAAIFVDF